MTKTWQKIKSVKVKQLEAFLKLITKKQCLTIFYVGTAQAVTETK